MPVLRPPLTMTVGAAVTGERLLPANGWLSAAVGSVVSHRHRVHRRASVEARRWRRPCTRGLDRRRSTAVRLYRRWKPRAALLGAAGWLFPRQPGGERSHREDVIPAGRGAMHPHGHGAPTPFRLSWVQIMRRKTQLSAPVCVWGSELQRRLQTAVRVRLHVRPSLPLVPVWACST
jgi:hypothetical protein